MEPQIQKISSILSAHPLKNIGDETQIDGKTVRRIAPDTTSSIVLWSLYRDGTKDKSGKDILYHTDDRTGTVFLEFRRPGAHWLDKTNRVYMVLS